MIHRTLAGAAVLAAGVTMATAHGDVAPQPVDTGTLPAVGEEWLTENPYRAAEAGEEVWAEAVRIGASGYNQNCARCHGLEVISGGLAPDLRFLEAEEYGDEWFIERFRTGYTQNGITKMPGFGDLLGQEAAWAIRTYVETRPDGDSIDAFADELATLRDSLKAGEADVATAQARLSEIAVQIDTMSGAPVADSIAFRAANLLAAGGTQEKAAETLTIGLSAAH
ncbi:cytochrome c-550 PedF [Roseivivax sp. CAU 1753]